MTGMSKQVNPGGSVTDCSVCENNFGLLLLFTLNGHGPQIWKDIKGFIADPARSVLLFRPMDAVFRSVMSVWQGGDVFIRPSPPLAPLVSVAFTPSTPCTPCTSCTPCIAHMHGYACMRLHACNSACTLRCRKGADQPPPGHRHKHTDTPSC